MGSKTAALWGRHDCGKRDQISHLSYELDLFGTHVTRFTDFMAEIWTFDYEPLKNPNAGTKKDISSHCHIALSAKASKFG